MLDYINSTKQYHNEATQILTAYAKIDTDNPDIYGGVFKNGSVNVTSEAGSGAAVNVVLTNVDLDNALIFVADNPNNLKLSVEDYVIGLKEKRKQKNVSNTKLYNQLRNAKRQIHKIVERA